LTYLYQKVDFIAISRGFHHMKKGVIMRQVEVPLRRYFGVNIDGLVKSQDAKIGAKDLEWSIGGINS
jgi:hypothetical protein